MKNFIFALFRPVKTFSEVKVTGKFSVMSLIIILFLMLINLILLSPITEKVVYMTYLSMSIPESQLDTMVQIAHKMRYLQIAGAIIQYVFMFFLYSFILYITVRIAKNRIGYKSALQLIVYSYFIVAIGDLTNTILLYARGLDAIANIYENSLIGLNLLTSVEQVGVTLYTFLCYFTPFQLIFVILLSIGLREFLEVKYIKTLTISVLFWLITISIPTLSIYFSNLAIEKYELI